MASTHRFPWTPDSGNGEYRNPVIHADYPDPDVIRHGDDFYLVASSFCCTPGLPILHSRDLVNWMIINHAIRQVPHPRYAGVQPGCGVWSPSIRHHAGRFWVFFAMPGEGIFVTTAEDPRRSWSEPWCLAPASGWIDPCPFWDDDGRTWIAYARSHAGIRNRIVLQEMSPDATRLIGESRVIIHAEHQDVLGGPKLHKIDGLYYILAPGGGVTDGWQLAYRSASLFGPYAEHVVLERGSTGINGPHQGALVDIDDGEWWFVHDQDAGPFGRITHLQPVRWINGWPEMGLDHDGNGVGEPVDRWKKPAVPADAHPTLAVPQTSDEFDETSLGRQWQWQANHEPAWASLAARPGWLRLTARPCADLRLTFAPHVLGQKFPARQFVAETLVDVGQSRSGEIACLAIVGGEHDAALGLRKGADGGHEIVFIHDGALHTVIACHATTARLRVRVAGDGCCTFSWSLEPSGFSDLPITFRAQEGGWMGARVGLIALTAPAASTPGGPADFDTLRFS